MDNSTSLLHHLTNDELKEILYHKTDKIEELAREDHRLRELESKRDMLIASNKSLAEYNLSREPAYNEARKRLEEAHREAVELKKEVENKKNKINELSQQTSLETTLALMQTATQEAEEASEQIANQFLSSEISVDTFLQSFIDSRKVSHLRRVKTDKLIEYVRHQQRNNTSSSSHESSSFVHPSRPAPPPPHAMPGVTPYPVAPTGMPQAPTAASFPFARSPYPPY